ncbi:trace amine-associated receptor 1-like [Brienomyrus brachyistius]|uniref:trace amine-associated receptor 1-like n=1 Tax=Brienomyrus brachyistius TaxID=42636 RepID=UPI0020B370A3|nr:trace amine-associated receptor 1-like [Brienomyrus brachyistius]
MLEYEKMNINESESQKNIQFCYESINSSCQKNVYPATVSVPVYVVLGATVLLTVLGNLLVIVTISLFRQLHTATNYLILSLATADLLLGVVVMPPSMVRSVETCWYFGNAFCRIHSSTDFTLSHASILHLTLISIERYYAVCQPFQYSSRISTSTIVPLIIISWTVSSFFGFGMIFQDGNIWGIENFSGNNYCEGGCFALQGKMANSISPALAFYVLALVILALYLKIFHVARKQASSIQSRGCVNAYAGNESTLIRKLERKATKTLGIVVGVFLSCWMPYFLCNTVNVLFGYETPVLLEVFGWIGYSNSGWNPVIYGFFYKWFRKPLVSAFWKLANNTKRQLMVR